MNACRSWHCLHSNVRRSTPGAFIGATSLIEVSPPHVGHSPSTPMGADWGACTLYPFALERAASPWKVQVPARTSCDGISIVLEPGPVDQPSCAILTTSPTKKLNRWSGVPSVRPAHPPPNERKSPAGDYESEVGPACRIEGPPIHEIGDIMRIHVGCELTFEFSQTMPMIVTLNVHFSRFSDLERPDHLVTNPSVPIEGYRDSFGNWCSRLVAPAGRFSLGTDAIVRDPGGSIRST